VQNLLFLGILQKLLPMVQKRLIYLVIFTVLGAYPVLFSQNNKVIRQIADLEQRRFAAMTQQDIPFLESVLAENVTYAHSNGLVENKAQHLENIRTGKITYQEIKVEESNTRVFKKTAVTTGIINVIGLYKGSSFGLRLGFTDVYVKQKRQWKLAAWRSVKIENRDKS
jgi:hypothetical protein